MKKLLALLLLAGFVAATCGDANAQEKKKPDPEARFKQLDKDNNGKLTLEEMKGKAEGKRAEALEKRFKALDKDGSGDLTLEEFKATPAQPKKPRKPKTE